MTEKRKYKDKSKTEVIVVTVLSPRGMDGHENTIPEARYIRVGSSNKYWFDEACRDLMTRGLHLDTARHVDPSLRVFIPPAGIIRVSQYKHGGGR